MARVCFSSDSFHSQKWLNHFYLEINKQTYFYWETETKPGKYEGQGESLI